MSQALAGHANVFVYHRFNDQRYPSTNISNEDFKAHLDLLRQNDFTVLTLGQIIRLMQSGEPLPDRCAAITVDDAYQSFMSDGWPILKSYGYPATLFVSTDSVGGGDYLDWQELQALRKDGVEIGNHSAAHAYMLDRHEASDWAQHMENDLDRSQNAFQEHLGYRPRLFAYPYGEYSPQLVEIVKAAGFEAAFGQQSGVIAPGADMFTLPRFPMGAGFVALESFRSKLFMNHLPITVLWPKSPVVTNENPPKLKFYLNSKGVAESTMRCFVPGQQLCQVDKVEGQAGVYEVIAAEPLSGRRSKYTVTASDAGGGAWYWFSQLWVFPVAAVTDDSVPGRE